MHTPKTVPYFQIAAAITAGLLVAACSKADEPPSSADKTAAPKTVAVAETGTQTPANAPAGESKLASAAGSYQVDNDHSYVVFRIERFGISHQFGTFNDISGTLTVAADAAKSKVAIELATESVFTANKKRDTHLKSPDFFDAKQFPKITFASTRIEDLDAGKLNVTGDLTMHGVTKSISIPFELLGATKDPWGGFRAGFVGSVTIQRSDFGITFMSDGLSDDVELTLAVEAVKQ